MFVKMNNISIDFYEYISNNSKLIYKSFNTQWPIETLYVFLVTPIALTAIILNIFNYFILNKIKIATTKLYDYLKLYSIISIIMSYSYSTMFLTKTPSYLGYFPHFLLRFQRCMIGIHVSSTIYIISNFLDVFIAFERLSIFILKLRPFVQMSALKLLFYLTLIALVINLPIYLTTTYLSDEEFSMQYLNLTNESVIAICGRTEFYYSNLNKLLTFIQMLFRDVITLIIELVTMILCTYYYRKFSEKFKRNSHHAIATQTNQDHSKIAKRKEEKLKQNFLMITILSITSSISHLCVSLAIISYIIKGLSNELSITQFITDLILSIKYTLNFFIFYFFNINFKHIIAKKSIDY
jgi:hypothetical protein